MRAALLAGVAAAGPVSAAPPRARKRSRSVGAASASLAPVPSDLVPLLKSAAAALPQPLQEGGPPLGFVFDDAPASSAGGAAGGPSSSHAPRRRATGAA